MQTTQSSLPSFGNFIAGEWKSSAKELTFKDVNPANRQDLIGEFQSSSREDVLAAIDAARESFPKWSRTLPIERGKILFKAAELLESQFDEVSKLLTREEGKTLPESKGEVQRGIELLRFYGGQAYRLRGDTYPSSSPKTLIYTSLEPLGVISILTPWNFPIAIPCWKIAPALVSGNTVVFKPASKTPSIAAKLVQALEKAGLTKGVLNFVTGSGAAAGEELVANENVDAISFTGSYEVGRNIQRIRSNSRKMIRVQLEMGGKNPTVVNEDVDISKAVQIVSWSAFGLTGQACTATSRVIVHEKVAFEFKTKIAERAGKLVVGNGLEQGVEMGPAASEAELEKDLRYIELGKKEGAKLLSGGARPSGEKFEGGYYISPTVFSDVSPDMQIARDEIFGPVLCVLEAKNLDEAIQLANNTEYGLTSCIITGNIASAMEFAQRSEVGIVKVNRTTPGVDLQVPFGGIKHSSSDNFKEQGEDAISFYTRKKAVYLGY
jgi:acyl-CoA reductase-like NAD-dependent aldehyde dehydrogenase